MKRKIILIGPEARAEVLKGAKYAADAVKLTLGPYGRNFASGIKGGPVAISNDGVSLLKEIEGQTEIQDLGVRAVREAATKTNDIAGDGTTGSAVLTQSTLEVLCVDDEGVIGAGRSTVSLIEKVKKEKDYIVELLKKDAVHIGSVEQLVAIARVSGEYEELATLIGTAQHTVGRQSAVICEEHNKTTDEVEYINGIRLDNGFPTSRIVNNPEKQCLEASNVPVILTNKVFHGPTFLKPLEKLLNQVILRGDKEIVLIGRGFDDDAIDLCLTNIKKGALKIYPINAPYTWQDEVMEDLGAILGAKYFKGSEHKLENMVMGDIGRASKVVCKRFETIIAGFAEGSDISIDQRVKERIEELDKSLKGDMSAFERRGRESRMSQMKHGTAIIYIGADTEQERRHKKDKVEDAINAVKWAYREGVVRGGGLALYSIAETLPDDYLLKEAIKAPYKQIMYMAPEGFTVEDWVMDPVKVVITALTNACDIASSLATTEVAINFEREKPQYVTTVDNKIADDSEIE